MTAPRLQHVPGGWLLAADLTDAPALPQVRLAQHQVATHRTWGAAIGLAVVAADGVLTVAPGVGVDRCGRTVVLARAATLRLPVRTAVRVVLSACGAGPAAAVRLREPGQEHDRDVPLARVDVAGTVHDGDGDRQWLRRPGPCRRIGGLVARGAPLAEPAQPAAAWSVHVDLTANRLDAPPAVVATPVGPAADPATVSTTVEVTSVQVTGFDLTVRHAVAAGAAPAATVIRTAPHAVAWLAVLPAPRSDVASRQEWS